MRIRQQVDRIAYMEERNACERMKRKAKEDVWKKIGKDLLEDAKGTKKLFYSVKKIFRKGNNETAFAVKDKDGNIVVEPEEVTKRWSEYFEELLNITGEWRCSEYK